ncbi:tetratricopeptide repeat protein [Enterovirga sp. CN4-39]|uniref:tetratricopeptide repeat protein n=1 Tax=Enterovirga sp. CN4-39 TaxID=3400910 RepID=UPI003C2AE650
MVAWLRKPSLAGAVGVVLVATLGAGMSPAWAKRSSAPARVESKLGFGPASSLEGNYLSAYIAGTARDTAAAAMFYREALKEDPRNPELLERAFVALLADGDLAGATNAAERIVKRDPQNGLAQLSLAVRAIRAKQYVTARSLLVRNGRGRAADLTATLLTAWAFAGSREGRRALDTADQLRGERGFSAFRDYHAGLIAALLGDNAEAERRLKAAYESEKTTLRIVDAYGRLLSKRGDRDGALAVYSGFDALSPRHPMVKAAMEQLRAGKTLPPLIANAQEGAAEVLYGLGSAGSQQGDELASIVYLRLALQLQPDHSLAILTLGEVYERLKRTEQALAILKGIPETSPLRASADVQIGISLEQLGRGEEAVQHLEKLGKQRPDDNDVLVALGNVYRSRKQYAQAAEIYGKAIERTAADDAGLWPLYYYRGTAYERAKDWPKAEADLKKALELVPDTQPMGKSQVLNYLGYSWVDQNINLDEAFKMLRRAVELNPRDGMIIDSLGWAYYRFGRWDDAVRELEKAAELKAGDPVINDHLGDAYWRVGRKLEAKFQWQHAKDAHPEPEDLAKIEEKLKNGLPEEPKPAEVQTSVPPGEEKSGG